MTTTTALSVLIPKTFELAGFTWTVRESARLKEKWGHCDLKKREIVLRASLEPEVKFQTFCHELTHAILIAMGKNSDEHIEEWVDAFAMFLHQYFKTAK